MEANIFKKILKGFKGVGKETTERVAKEATEETAKKATKEAAEKTIPKLENGFKGLERTVSKFKKAGLSADDLKAAKKIDNISKQREEFFKMINSKEGKKYGETFAKNNNIDIKKIKNKKFMNNWFDVQKAGAGEEAANLLDKAMWHQVPQKTAAVGVPMWMISNMQNKHGEMSNPELYGQKQPYS